MNVIYTYCNFNNTEFSDFFLKMSKLSMFFSNRSIENANVILYCDKSSYNFFKQIRYINDIKIIDYSKYNFDKRAWNFPKLVSYSLQKEKFVHVDLDLSLLKPIEFSDDVDIFSEKTRKLEMKDIEYIYCDKDYELPKEIYCSGVFGGNNLELYQQLFFYANKYFNKDYCKNKEIGYENLYALEEVLTTQIMNKNNFKAQLLDQNKYIHFWERPKEVLHSHIIDSLINTFSIC